MKNFIQPIFCFSISFFFIFSMVSCYDAEVTVTKKRDFPHYTLEEIELGSLNQEDLDDSKQPSLESIIAPTEDDSNFSSTNNSSNLEVNNSETNIDTSYNIDPTSNSSDTSVSTSDSNSNSTSNFQAKYPCSNSYLPLFVEKLSLSEVKDLNILIKNVCNNSEYYKFFEKDFGWKGDPKDKASYVKILKQKKINSITFEFIIGMSFLLPKTEGSSYLNDIFKAYTDANWFQTHYVHPDNIKIQLENINRPLDSKGFDISYTMFVNIMKVLTTSFKSNFIATIISDNFTVFTERSFDDKDSLMKRKHISFLNTSDKDFDHFVVFEYRILNTKFSALSSIAKDFMDTMDNNMMDAVYQNALLRKKSLN